MKKYWLVLKIGWLDILEYKIDFLLSNFKYALMVLILALVWIAVGQAGQTDFSAQQTWSYFFWAALLYGLSNFHTYYVEDDIRLGSLGKFLVKPVNPFLYYLAFQTSHALMETGLKLLVIGPILFLLGHALEWRLSSLAAMAGFMPLIFFFAFNYYVTISTLSFWLTEAWALRWSLTILLRFLAGILVPLSFLPFWFQTWSFWLPFQHLAYTPIQLVQDKITNTEAGLGWLVLLSWTLGLVGFRNWLWHQGIKAYENIGI